MAAFRKGHSKVVKWLVKHVTQFPSDTELNRFIATISDKVRLFLFTINLTRNGIST
jgi:ankyrin repeat domain-containing protein 17